MGSIPIGGIFGFFFMSYIKRKKKEGKKEKMTKEQKAAYVYSQTTCALIEMQSQVMANFERQRKGEAIAYNEEAFYDLINKWGIHHNDVISLFHDYNT